ncbi:MAG: class IV adenylate cyclase [Candidatus Pacebacteria bacterium]|nr:class IV adenylate cyclase [Candidatus Paceibacterota bacterium]
MREIEIKAKLKNKARTMKRLRAMGCVFEAPITQNDSVYTKRIGSLAVYRNNDAYLRIRIKNGIETLFTYKKKGVNDLDSIEHEVTIDSKEEMEHALLHMGYKKAMKIDKVRTITHYNGCEICIDNVKGLGIFIEMEKLTNSSGSANKIQDELFEFFKAIGIDKKDRVASGYDILILQKNSKRR